LALAGGFGVAAFAQPPKATAPKADPAAKPADRKPVEKMEDLPEIGMDDADSAEVTRGKKMILLQLKRYSLIEKRITGGQFVGAANYIQLTDTLAELTAAAEVVYPDAKAQLPWFEFRLAQLTKWEGFNAPRVTEGTDEPQLGPQLRAAMFKAELALLKVQKLVKK
jgi:hypothetical protein